MPKINTYVAGNTLGAHEEFVRQLKRKGAKVVEPPQTGDHVTIVFCPIVSRFECDAESALSSAKELGIDKVILVAMHHTFDKNYSLPTNRELDNRAVVLVVDCLFFERMGLLACSRNEKAVKMVCEELDLGSNRYFCCKKRGKCKNGDNNKAKLEKKATKSSE